MQASLGYGLCVICTLGNNGKRANQRRRLGGECIDRFTERCHQFNKALCRRGSSWLPGCATGHYVRGRVIKVAIADLSRKLERAKSKCREVVVASRAFVEAIDRGIWGAVIGAASQGDMRWL